LLPRLPTILIIDPDPAAGRELRTLLLNWPMAKQIIVYQSVAGAKDTLATGRVDWLFIRINQWDDYQQLAAEHKQTSRHIVFLSGRSEKCTGHLQFSLDAHLQPPYKASRLVKVWNRLTAPAFERRPLDIFFVKSRARYFPIRYGDLQEVERSAWTLKIKTRQAEYRITGTLTAFQARLPIPLNRSRGGVLSNEAYELDPNHTSSQNNTRPWLI
jgi:DNA-binding LytR/AlgR family response regulator